jgi:hypothetical protein
MLNSIKKGRHHNGLLLYRYTRLVDYQFTRYLFGSVFYFQYIYPCLNGSQLDVLVDKTSIFMV